jgi:hypothetical protein
MQLRSQNATLSESNARLEERLLEAIEKFNTLKEKNTQEEVIKQTNFVSPC